MLRARTACCLLVSVVLSGCLTATVTLDPDGSGTLVYTYFPPRHATYATERRRLTSPSVRVTDLAGGKMTTATVAFSDATRLATAEAFRGLVVTRGRHGDADELTIVVPVPPTLRPAASDATIDPTTNPGPVVTLTLPGPIEEAIPAGTVRDRTVTWSMPLRDFAARDDWTLTVRWRARDADAPADQSM